MDILTRQLVAGLVVVALLLIQKWITEQGDISGKSSSRDDYKK